MYALLFSLALGVGHFFERVMAREKRRDWIGLGFVSSLAYVTHYFSLLLSLTQFIIRTLRCICRGDSVRP